MIHVKTSTEFSFVVIIFLLQYNTTVFICYNIVKNKPKKTCLGTLQSVKLLCGRLTFDENSSK